MLIVLFVFEIIIMGLTILTTHMVEHKFKMIKISLNMYGNKRTYKTKSNLDFIESILTMYQKIILDTNQEPDLESAIKRRLHQESIGKFGYISVKNIAIKSRHLMWMVLGLELVIAWMNQEFYSRQALFWMGGSLFITLMMAFYGIIKGIDEKGEVLIDEIIHYVKNVRPLEEMRGRSTVESKQQSMPISFETHKIRKEGLKLNEKEFVRDQAYELRNYDMQKMLVHKEKNLQTEQVINNQAEQQNNRESQKLEEKFLETTTEMSDSIEKMNDQRVSIQKVEGNVTEEEIELSASDIAKLLTHL